MPMTKCVGITQTRDQVAVRGGHFSFFQEVFFKSGVIVYNLIGEGAVSSAG